MMNTERKQGRNLSPLLSTIAMDRIKQIKEKTRAFQTLIGYTYTRHTKMQQLVDLCADRENSGNGLGNKSKVITIKNVVKAKAEL